MESLGRQGQFWMINFHLGSCQNRGPFLGTLNSRCRIILGTQKGTIIVTTTHLGFGFASQPKTVRMQVNLILAMLTQEKGCRCGGGGGGGRGGGDGGGGGGCRFCTGSTGSSRLRDPLGCWTGSRS